MNSNKTKRAFKARNKPNKNQQPSVVGEMKVLERMEHPPQINGYQIVKTVHLRFTATAAAPAQQITFQNLLDCQLIAVTAIAGFDLFDMCRIKKIEVWGIAALGTPSSIRVAFNTTTGDQIIHSDTSLGFKPAHVQAVPNAKSLASFFQVSGAGNAFALSVPAGAVIDIHLECKTTASVPTAALNALVGATVGELYYRGLDGLASAGTNFPPPVGIQTI